MIGSRTCRLRAAHAARRRPTPGRATLLGLLRARRRRLALFNVMFMLCGLLALGIAPCQAMAGMQAAGMVHDCPNCPAAPCHDMRPAACPHQSANDPTTLPDLPRFELPVGLPSAELALCAPAAVDASPPVARCGPLPGRRPHLVFLRFNE